MEFHGWGSPKAVGTGILFTGFPVFHACAVGTTVCRDAVWYYGMRYTLTKPRWCVGSRRNLSLVRSGLHYTEVTVETFGPDTNIALVPLARRHAAIHRLLKNIGRAGVPRNVRRSSSFAIKDGHGQPVDYGCVA